MSNEYIVVDDGDYAPEAIITTWDDLAEECAERGIDTSSLRIKVLKEYLASGRKANNYMWVHKDGSYKTAEELAAE